MLIDRLRRGAAAILVVTPGVLATLVGTPALAQPTANAPSTQSLAERQELARMKAEQGLKLFGAARWSEAYDWFREADVLFHAPTLTLYMARSQRQAGKLLEARVLYERLVAEPVPTSAAVAFVEAHDNAKVELDKLRAVIPAVQFSIVDAPRASVKVTLDGAPVPDDKSAAAAATGAAFVKEMNPGSHTVELTELPGGKNDHSTRTFTIVEGPNPRVELRVHPLPVLVAQPSLIATPAGPPDRGSFVPGGVVLGFGIVGLGIGAGAGLASISQANAVKAQCAGNVCPLSAKAEANSSNGLGTASTVAFVLGGVASATGVVLLIVRPRSARKAAAPTHAIDWNAGIGAGRVQVGGTF